MHSYPNSLSSNPASQQQAALARLRWRCRRGMLELDLLFVDFVNQHLAQLTPAQMAALNDLLDLPDQQLWKLLTVSDEGVDAVAQQVLAKLRAEA
jgi:antitoxin CptB